MTDPVSLRIVVLDSFPLDAGDIDFSPLGAYGEVRIHAGGRPEETAERMRPAQAVFTNKVRIADEHFAAARGLRFVGVLATGYDCVDVKAAARRGITVCNVPGYGTDSVAQTTIALLLELTQHIGDHARAVREGRWSLAPAFSFWEHPLMELEGKTFALVGAGAIGRRVGRIAEAFGLRVVAARVPGSEGGRIPWPRIALEEAWALADVISLHCPLTPATRGIVGASEIARMKPGALLLNTSRGGLVDEEALARALEEGRLGGYAADVLSREPPPADHPLLRAPRCLITPHLSWATFEARRRLLAASVENLRAFLAGQPRNVVS